MPFEFVVQSAGEDSSRGLLDATRVMDKPSSLSVERFRGVGGGNTASPTTSQLRGALPHAGEKGKKGKCL